MQQTPNLNLNKPDGTDVVDIADLNANMDIIDTKMGTTGHDHSGTAGNGPKITAGGLANGAATDTVIGNRTITDTVAAASAADTLANLFNKIGYMIKNITGKSNWYTLPAINLETINTLFGTGGHAHTGIAGQGPKIAYSNLSGTPTTMEPATHSSATTSYGVSTASAYGHAMASSVAPLVNGAAAVGTDNGKFARENHVHPTDTTRAPLASPALTGVPTAPTAAAGTSTTQIATTAFVQATVNNPVVWDYTVPANVSSITLPQSVIDLLNTEDTPFSILFHLNVVGASTVNHLYGIRPSTNGNSSYVNIASNVYSDIRNGALSSLIIGHYDGAITRTWGSGLPGVCFMRSTVIRKNNTLNLAGLNVYHIPDVKTYDQPTLGQLFMNGTATSYTIGCYLTSGADSGGVITAGTRIIVKKEV